MSMMGELTYFLGLQIKQDKKGISICQEQYIRNLLKKYEISDSSLVKTPMVPPNNLGPDLAGKPVNETSYRGMIRYLKGTPNLGLYYPKCSGFDLKGYSDSDYAGCYMDRKSTLAEAEYVATTGCCASILWMKSQLSDYDIHYKMNILREFWSTTVAYDPFPLIDETDQRLLREFLIKFSVLNGQRPYTFCSSTSLDYNNVKYVAHPTPEAVNKEFRKLPSIRVLGENYSSTEQDENFGFLPGILSNSNFTKDPSKVTDIELTAHMITVNNQRDSMSPIPLSTKPKKGKSQTVTLILPKSQGPEASRALSKKRQKPKSKKPPTETKVTPPKPAKGSEQSHSVSSGTVPDPQDLERKIQLASIGLPSTLNEGTHKSKPFPESITIDPKDSVGNKQPIDIGLPSTTFDEGTAKTTSRLKGSLGDKDSGGNIPLADIELIHHNVADLSGTGAKYQVDETQSTRLRYQSLTKNKGKTSSEDELDKDSDEEEVLAAGEDIDKDPQVAEEVRTPSPKQDQPEPSHVQESTSDSSSLDLKKFDNILSLIERKLIKYLRKILRVLFSRITEKQWEQHEEATVSYADLKASIKEYYDENVAHRDQTDKLVESTMSTINKSSTTIKDLYQGLNVITKLLKDINNAIKDDPTTNKKLDEAIETFAKISTNTTKVLSLVKDFDFSTFQSIVKDLQAYALKQEEVSASWTKTFTNMPWNIGSRMTAIEIS
ncbi:hypothetical protein Tco_1300520 [Tanacetum coccineum]